MRRASPSSCAIAGPAGTRRARWCSRRRTAMLTVEADASVLALGGASWPQLGSSGAWVDVLRAAGVRIAPLQPANCGFLAPWSEIFRSRLRGRAPEAARAVVRHRTCARRGAHHRGRTGRRRHLCPVRAPARGHRRRGRGDPAYRSAPRRRHRGAGAAAGRAARQAVAVDVPAQGREPVAGGHRLAARGDAGGPGACRPPCRRPRSPPSSRRCRCA